MNNIKHRETAKTALQRFKVIGINKPKDIDKLQSLPLNDLANIVIYLIGKK